MGTRAVTSSPAKAGAPRKVTGRRVLAGAVSVAAVLGVAALLPSQSQAALNPNALFVAPAGSASAPGTQSSPTTLAAAVTRITAGGTIYLRGGTYSLSSTVAIADGNDGKSNAFKQIAAYPGERPVLDFSKMSEASSNRGILLGGDYWRLTGFTVQRAGDNGIYVSGSYNILEGLVTRANRDTGLQIGATSSTARSAWPAHNLVISSESYDNRDSGGENADGFAAKLTSGPGNVFRYTVAHNNVDDGWDLYAKTETGPIDPVTIEDSLAYGNGTLTDGTQATAGDRNGFKLGGSSIAVKHVIRRSIAFRNGQHGLTWNSNPGPITVSDNLSIDNTERNFAFDKGTSVFTNNTSCRFSGKVSDTTSGSVASSNQFWTGANGSRCAAYSGDLKWSFAADGRLVVTIGGKAVVLGNAPAPTPTPTTTTATPTPTPTTTTPTSTTTTTTPTPTTTKTPTTTTTPTTTGTTSPSGSVLLSDDFADGDAAGWAFTGGTWRVSSGALGQSAAGTAVATRGSTAWTGVDVRVTGVVSATTGSGAAFGVLARVKDASNHYALVLRDANKAELRRVSGGKSKVIAGAVVKAATGKPFTLRLVASGSALTGYVNGTQVLTATDGTFAAGAVGLVSVNETVSLDDVAARAV